MKAPRNIKLRILTALSLFFCALITGGAAAAVARGYTSADNDLKPGMVVRLSPESTPDNQKVERATIEDLDRIVGIAVNPDDSDVTIASAKQSVYIETSGEADAYVTDLDGVIRKGDLITLSPLKGILTKGHSGSRIILGIALEDFSTKEIERYTIDSTDGKKEVEIAKIRVNLDRQGSAGQQASETDSQLKKLGRSIVGKDVSEIRVIIAILVFIIVLVAEGSILYGAISSAITSIGRNPLAKGLIKNELVRVVGITMFVLTIGIGALYGILWA